MDVDIERGFVSPDFQTQVEAMRRSVLQDIRVGRLEIDPDICYSFTRANIMGQSSRKGDYLYLDLNLSFSAFGKSIPRVNMSFTASELRDIAKDMGIERVKNMTRIELINKIKRTKTQVVNSFPLGFFDGQYLMLLDFSEYYEDIAVIEKKFHKKFTDMPEAMSIIFTKEKFSKKTKSHRLSLDVDVYKKKKNREDYSIPISNQILFDDFNYVCELAKERFDHWYVLNADKFDSIFFIREYVPFFMNKC